MKNFSVEAIVLSHRNFSEGDRFVTLLTREHGKLSALAKGVRKINSRRGPHLDLFTHCRVFIHETSKGHLIIAQASTVEEFGKLKKDLKKIALSFYACEMVSKLTRDNQAHDDIFERLLLFLCNLNNRDLPTVGFESIINSFQRDVLKRLGFADEKLARRPNLRYYIEEVLEGKLKSPDFLEKIGI
jgi:DNA repair protein RecO